MRILAGLHTNLYNLYHWSKLMFACAKKKHMVPIGIPKSIGSS